MRKVLLSVFVVSFAGFCFAPIQLHDRPANLVRPNAATEQDYQRQQGEQKTVGEVGTVPQIDNPANLPTSSGPRGSDSNAQGALGQTQNGLDKQADTARQAEAQQALVKVQENLEGKKSGPVSMFFMGGIFLCVGFGVIFGVRQWANKTIPTPDVLEAKKVNW